MNSITASLQLQFCCSAAKFPVRCRSVFIHSPLTHRNHRRFICMPEPYLITKLESAEKTWKELSVKLADPDVVSNPNEFRKLAQSLAELDEVVSTFRRLKDCEKQLEETKDDDEGLQIPENHDENYEPS